MTIDITRPHIGRIYDYVLGGTQNYEADRVAAKAMIELVPAYPRWARINRSFLSFVGQRWSAEGLKRVLDLGSGLPTQGHFNEHLPDAKVLFSDFDPLTVLQAQQLLAYTPEMAYANIDLRDPVALIEQASTYFGADRRLGVGCIGVVYFLSDDEVRSLMQRLHAFCARGSVMALSFHNVPAGPDFEGIKQAVLAAVKHAQINLYTRTTEQIAELVLPWRIVRSQRIQDWLGREEEAAPDARPDDPMRHLELVGAFAEH
jgi:O-methyltransferase involved in polyketide biosynthesis